MFSVTKWFENLKNGDHLIHAMDEKNEAINRKRQVAMKILCTPEQERRRKPVPVEIERRMEIYDYHQKLV